MADPASTMDFAALRQQLVDNQIRPSDVTDRELIQAILAVPREMFVDPTERPFAYSDRELRMPGAPASRRMIDPVQFARLVQMLDISNASKVMIVGCGSGYSAAILSRLAGSVVALEEDERLHARAADLLPQLGCRNVTFVRGALPAGHPAEAPYDAILMDGSVEFVPDALASQLRPGGQLAAIVREEGISRAMLYERVGGGLTHWPQFEAWAAPLPGFERRREFVF